MPFRMEVGPRDVDAGSFVLKSRIDGSKEVVKLDGRRRRRWLRDQLDTAHQQLFDKAQAFRDANTRDAPSYDEMKQILEEQGGFVRCFFKPDRAAEAKIKEETKATVRVFPFDQPGTKGKCHLHRRGNGHAGAVRDRVLRSFTTEARRRVDYELVLKREKWASQKSGRIYVTRASRPRCARI